MPGYSKQKGKPSGMPKKKKKAAKKKKPMSVGRY